MFDGKEDPKLPGLFGRFTDRDEITRASIVRNECPQKSIGLLVASRFHSLPVLQRAFAVGNSS